MTKSPVLYNRENGELEYENTYKVDGLAFLYGTKFGKAITGSVINKRRISSLYGRFVKSKKSTAQIPKFIDHYGIDTEEIKRPLSSFVSFNDFFIRELKEGTRPIDSNPSHLISTADSRLLVFDLQNEESLPVKGYWYRLDELIKDKKLVSEYGDGWCFIYRLAPSDYHRYCYIDNGTQEKVKRLRGVLNSVHPIALSVTKSLIARNYRELTILQTENFGDVLHIEVGALFVGKIVQHQKYAYHFQRGEEKGYFEFGGSTIVQLFKKGTILPDADILEYSLKNIETLVKMGEKVGVKL
ncbi:MAG: phosphatidylserine decarboxylase [Draconibacterium sp.]